LYISPKYLLIFIIAVGSVSQRSFSREYFRARMVEGHGSGIGMLSVFGLGLKPLCGIRDWVKKLGLGVGMG